MKTQDSWLLTGAILGVLFTLLNLVNLTLLEGEWVRDLVGVGIGLAAAGAAYARYRGWKGLLR